MKSTLILLATLATLGSSAWAKSIDISDVPAIVLNTIEDNIPPDRLDDIRVNVNNSGDRYVVRLSLKGERVLRIYVSSDGELLKVRREIKLKNLPKPVRNAIQDFLDENEGEVQIERVTKGSQVRYVITVNSGDSNEEDVHIVVTPDGKILESEEDLDIQQLSKRLRRAVNNLLEEGDKIDDIDRVVEDGETTYRVVVELSGGSKKTFTLDAKGEVIDEESGASAT